MRFPCPHPYLRYIQKGLVSSERGKDYAYRKLSGRQHQTMIDVSWGEKERSPYQRQPFFPYGIKTISHSPSAVACVLC